MWRIIAPVAVPSACAEHLSTFETAARQHSAVATTTARQQEYLTYIAQPQIIGIIDAFYCNTPCYCSAFLLQCFFDMDYKTVKEMAEVWSISTRRIRKLCETGRLDGVKRNGSRWMIPADTLKPVDARHLRHIEIPFGFAPILGEIDAMKAEIMRRHPLSLGEIERLRHEFLVEYTYSSNAIEGNTLTFQETAMVLEGMTIDQKPLKDHLEAIGHRDAFSYLEEIVKEKKKLSERFIKELHCLVLQDKPEDRGVYRRIPVSILGAAHTPPQPYLIIPEMEKLLLDFSKSRLHPIAEAAIFHIHFETIHPFIDGNGRTGRLLINFMLMRHGYLPVSIKFSERRTYYDAFTAYHTNGDIAPMLHLVSRCVHERLSKYLSIFQ